VKDKQSLSKLFYTAVFNVRTYWWRCERSESAWWGVRQRTTSAGLHETTHRRVGL